MPAYAELEMGLYRTDASRFSLRLRFWEPGSLVENNLGLDQPAQVTFQDETLRAAQNSFEKYGPLIAAQLFAAPAVQAAFSRARVLAAARQAILRVRLYIEPDAAALHGLRWETLVDPEKRSWICTDENLLFSRFLSSSSLAAFEPPVVERLRALVAIASPTDLADYGLEVIDVPEQARIAQAGFEEMEVRLLANQGQASLNAILDGLRDGCDIFYLVAHGGTVKGKNYLFLENEDGGADVVPVGDFITRLGELRQLPILAVLISCQSAGTGVGPGEQVMVSLGPGLADTGIPAVLAMQGKITFPTMAEFLPAFFRELERDGSIDRACAVARGKVRNRLDWWMPVLFSRLRDNILLKPSPAAAPLALQPYEPETIFIPRGKFWMGRGPGPDVPACESPCHEVDLAGYRIGKFPVTNRQYAEFIRQRGEAVTPEMGWNGQLPQKEALDLPVSGVTWYQAMAYCAWLSARTGRAYTLPNEAQWEKACRGKQGWMYPWGDEWQEQRCNSQPAQLERVDRYIPQSPFGCYDMLGNAREWTTSLWGEKRGEPDQRFVYPWKDDERNDPGENPLVRRIFRGGVADSPAEMTCTARNGFAPDKPGPPGKRHGFRVVLLTESGSAGK